ncbi:metallophosphoesterase [Flavobacterium alkalisoli]|uniref:metallophosphoesterase n=1 Tax=Flavobacterium alkalisoli TaxID=2602769 RepID=UPI003A95260A
MKFFWVNMVRCRNIKLLLPFFIVFTLFSCASYDVRYGKNATARPLDTITQHTISHRFVLVGDAGYAARPNSQEVLGFASQKLKTTGKNTTLLYLGDNIYPHGMPPKKDKEGRKAAEESLLLQLKLSDNFEGTTHFIPGNHDWYSGLDGLKDQEDFIKDYLKVKKSYLPGDGCGIDDLEVNDSLTLIVIDSEWFLEDWDKYPTINDDCDIKTREGMILELESLLNKNQGKTIILAIHHPLMTNGSHGGQLTLRKQLYPLEGNIPLPVLGSIMNFVRNTSGGSPQDIQGKQYNTLSKRVKTLVQGKDNVIVISGHDHNLQYIYKDNIHQIISGAGSKAEGAKAINPDDFSYGGSGYAVLDVYDTYTSKITYYAVKDGKEEMVFEKYITRPKPKTYTAEKFRSDFPKTVQASVYTPEMTKKGGFYKFLFGNYYRSYFSTPIEASTVNLDTLYGGLTPLREGGGHQSMSVRMENPAGKEYVMRGVKKSANRFLQTVAFKNLYIGSDFDQTVTESFLMDFYTSSHPFTPFIVGDLADAVGIYHTNPKLYYIPKQNALAEFNTEYGNALYMLEERPMGKFKDEASFGNPDDIESTDDVLDNMRKNPKYTVDEKAFIRARLFDMIVGDWDRHTDQWRWSRFNEKDSVVYRPIPRDRDQAFPNYGGVLLPLIMNMPPLRYMQDYKDHIKSVKWLAFEPYPMDMALIRNADETTWLEQARFLKENLTDEVIDSVFKELPKEVQDDTMEEIKSNLRKRRDDIEKYALKYRAVLLKTVLITGTDKKEHFVINRLPEGETRVQIYSIKKDDEELIRDNTYNRKQTKELWIYGLDDDDIFEVKGKPEKPILIRLLGGQNNDEYLVENGKKVKVYDFKSKKNTYNIDGKTRLLLTNDYETNTYNFKKPTYNAYTGLPTIGFNPDDGVKLGFIANYTVNNFNRRPFSQKHTVKANLYFATTGFELDYIGKFMNVVSKWNFGFNVHYTSPTFSINYFGYGNETPNNDDNLGMDYNRVKLQTFSVAPAVFKETPNGSYFEVYTMFTTVEVEETNNRFISTPGIIPDYLMEHRQFARVNGKYKFENYDIRSLPSMGMLFSVNAGWTVSMDEFERNFPYLEGTLGFTHKITGDNNLVFSTTFKGRSLLNNNFEFYQASTLGGDTDLRGYRNQRFTGKESYLQSSDLRLTLGRFKSSIIPIKYGIFGGYDYGRVWIDGDDSRKWHQSAGGGIWLNGVEALTAKAFYFHGSDGGRIAFGLLFGF